MKIKKFSAASMREAMYKVKEELGSEAIILKSEKVAKGGLFDFSETKYIYEITAAIDKIPLKINAKPSIGIKTLNKEKSIEVKKTKDEPALENISNKFRILDLKTDLKHIENKIDNAVNHIKYNEMPNLPDTLMPFYMKLKDSFVDEKIIKDIMMKIYMDFTGEEFNNKQLIEDSVKKQIKDRLKTFKPPKNEKKIFAGPKVIALIGPTGVGKTTTLAKLAFNTSFYGGKKVGLITADTYRIAAIDQLKTYCNITQIPLEVIYKPEQIRKALVKYNNYDVVLVDTAGRSQRNVKQLSELKRILYEGGVLEVYLVLSMTTRNEDQDDIIKRFSAVNFNKIIFTKLDETSGFGGLLNASVNYNIPIEVLTFGQNVPDDIEYADADKIADMILYPEKVVFE